MKDDDGDIHSKPWIQLLSNEESMEMIYAMFSTS